MHSLAIDPTTASMRGALLLGRAQMAVSRGEVAMAADFFERAATAYLSCGMHRPAARVLLDLAHCSGELGESARRQDAVRRALDALSRIGPREEAWERARKSLEEALARRADVGDALQRARSALAAS